MQPMRSFTRGKEFFELSNHLGNVLETVTDRLIQMPAANNVDVAYSLPDVASATDYYSFGMQMPGRTYSSASYRYGLNGQEKSTEIDPHNNSMTAEFWQYDARLGRRWNLDPKPSVGISHYSAFLNNPIAFADAKGDTIINTDVARALGRDKSGQDLAGNATQAGDFSLVPIQKSLNDKTIIGYNAWRNGRNEYQLDPGDVSSFKSNSAELAKAADMFYAGGAPDYDQIRYFYGALNGDWKNMAKGFKGMWSKALHDPIYVASLVVAFGNVGINAMSPRSGGKPPSNNNFVDESGNIIWPSNNGFVNTPAKVTLKPNQYFDRYGYEGGSFASPLGTPFAARSLAPGTQSKPYTIFKVVKSFEVEAGKAAPYFNQPGGGTQYVLPKTIKELKAGGYIEEIFSH